MFSFHKNQRKIINSDKRFRVAVCGRRFGKTLMSIWEMYGYAAFNKGSRVVYIAPTIKQSRDICWSELKKVTRSSWSKPPNETRLEVYLKCDHGGMSEIWLRGSENIESLRGLKIDFLVVDEVASITEWVEVWRKVLRPTLVDSQGHALFTGTPQGLNHFYQMYLNEKVDENWQSFRFTSYDNPFIPSEEIDAAKFEAESTNTMDEFRQEYLAEFVTVSGQVYKEWDSTSQFIELKYEPSLPLYISMDFGVNDPTSIIWMQRNGGEYRVIDYYEASDANIGHFLQVLRGKPYKVPEMYCGDPAGKARNVVTGTSIIEEYRKSGIYIRSIDGVRIPDQVRITHRYMKSLYVNDSLGRFRDCILNYRYPAKDGSNEIPLHDQYSHAMRALEYMFVNLDNIMPSTLRDIKPQFVPADPVIGV